MTNVLTELHDKINEGVTAVEGWVGELKGHLPQIVDLAGKIQNSPIVQALESAVLPPNVEQEIAKLIQEASTAFAEHGTATVTGSAGPAATTDSEPTTAPADAASAQTE
jgi:hypothetical protein